MRREKTSEDKEFDRNLKAIMRKLRRWHKDGTDPIYKLFPLGSRVKGVVNGKERLGTVKKKPYDQLACFAPFHVPVLWDCNETMISATHRKNLTLVT